MWTVAELGSLTKVWVVVELGVAELGSLTKVPVAELGSLTKVWAVVELGSLTMFRAVAQV